MASAVASIELPKPVFLMDIIASPSASGKAATSACRPFSTGGSPPRSSSDGVKDSTGKDAAADADRPRERDLSIPKLFTGGVLGLFPEAARRGLQLLALAEDGGLAASMITGFSPRGWWVSKEDGDAVLLKVAMPGLGKEHVKMRAEKNVLLIKGEGDKDSEGDDDKGSGSGMVQLPLPSQAFKMDQIKAEMNNGMLSLTVSQIKDDEHKNVFEIKLK